MNYQHLFLSYDSECERDVLNVGGDEEVKL